MRTFILLFASITFVLIRLNHVKSKGRPSVARNYKKETAWEDTPVQVKRREARNTARAKAEKKGKVHKGDGKEVDHQGFHPTGSLKKVPVKVVSRSANRKRQPPHKGY